MAWSMVAKGRDRDANFFDHTTRPNAKLRRRSAIAVIGHTKTDGHLGRCYLKGQCR
jgi:hypothetical protein